MNNKIILFFVIACGFMCSSTLYAQQKINPTLEVRRNFDGKMLEINKSKLNTYVADSLSNFNLNFNYSIFDKPYRDMYEFTPLPSAKIHSPVSAKYPVFMANVGLGVPLNPNVELYFQPRLSKQNNTVLVKAFYNSFWGDIPLVGITNKYKTAEFDDKVAADNYVVGAGAYYGHTWKGGRLNLGVDYSSNYYTYYGFSEYTLTEDLFNLMDSKYMRDNFSHTFNKFAANFNINSVDAQGKGAKFNYNFYASFQNTSDKIALNSSSNNKFNENLFKVGGEFGPTFGKYNKFLIGINSETAIYSGFTDYHYGIIEFIPQYKFERKRLVLNIGAKLSGRYTNNDYATEYHSTFAPHVTVSYAIAKNNLWIYGIADGGNSVNSYSSLLDKNKWVVPSDNIMASSIPLLIKGGLKGKAYDKFSYEVYASYTIHKGLMQFINNSSGNRFLTAYSNHKELSFGGEVNWIAKEFTGGLKAKYSSYTKGKNSTIENGHTPYGYAPFEGTIYGEYNWRERIYIGADMYFRSATPFYNVTYINDNPKVTEFFNLGVTAKYVINNNFTVYIQGSNLLNANIQYYSFYLEKGINFGAGVMIKF
ncbi:MAG: hypothetical protein RR312_03250 [Bacteroidales bacterium]